MLLCALFAPAILSRCWVFLLPGNYYSIHRSGGNYLFVNLLCHLIFFLVFIFFRYKSRSYRARMVREPRVVLKEFGTTIPENVSIRIHDSTADCRYLVIPRRPPGTEDMNEEELRKIITRDSMVGVRVLCPYE